MDAMKSKSIPQQGCFSSIQFTPSLASRRSGRFSPLKINLMLKWDSLQAIKARFQYFACWSDEQVLGATGAMGGRHSLQPSTLITIYLSDD